MQLDLPLRRRGSETTSCGEDQCVHRDHRSPRLHRPDGRRDGQDDASGRPERHDDPRRPCRLPTTAIVGRREQHDRRDRNRVCPLRPGVESDGQRHGGARGGRADHGTPARQTSPELAEPFASVHVRAPGDRISRRRPSRPDALQYAATASPIDQPAPATPTAVPVGLPRPAASASRTVRRANSAASQRTADGSLHPTHSKNTILIIRNVVSEIETATLPSLVGDRNPSPTTFRCDDEEIIEHSAREQYPLRDGGNDEGRR